MAEDTATKTMASQCLSIYGGYFLDGNGRERSWIRVLCVVAEQAEQILAESATTLN